MRDYSASCRISLEIVQCDNLLTRCEITPATFFLLRERERETERERERGERGSPVGTNHLCDRMMHLDGGYLDWEVWGGEEGRKERGGKEESLAVLCTYR